MPAYSSACHTSNTSYSKEGMIENKAMKKIPKRQFYETLELSENDRRWEIQN